MPLGWLLADGGWLPEESVLWSELELLVPSPFSGEGRGPGDWVNHQWQIIKSITPTKWGLHKNPNQKSLESFWVNIYMSWELGHPNSMGTEALALRALPDLALCTSLSGCSSLYCILYNKPINVSIYLSFVRHYGKLSKLERELWNPRFTADSLETQVTTWHVWLGSTVGLSLVGLSP